MPPVERGRGGRSTVTFTAGNAFTHACKPVISGTFQNTKRDVCECIDKRFKYNACAYYTLRQPLLFIIITKQFSSQNKIEESLVTGLLGN